MSEKNLFPVQRIRDDAHALAVINELLPLLAEGALERDRGRLPPIRELDLLSRSGLLAITVPAAYGGADVSAHTLAQVSALISQADPSLGQIPQNHFYAIEVLRIIGSPAQKTTFFEGVLAGKRFGSAFAERGTRTSAAGDRKTRLYREGGRWFISGSKAYCTGASYADWLAVWLREDDGVQRVALIPRDAEGVTVRDDWAGMGQRTTASGTTILERVPVEVDCILPIEEVFRHPSRLGPFSQLYHAAIDLGIARAALSDMKDFVRTRSRPWIDSKADKASDDPLTLQDYGRLTIDVHVAESLLELASQSVQAAKHLPSEESVAAASIAVAQLRIATNDVALGASSKLLEHAGAQATLEQYNLDRHWRNARTHTLHDPVRWKSHAIGNFYLNNVLPARRGSL